MHAAAQVVMFHKYPQDLLRGWLRQHNIRDDQVWPRRHKCCHAQPTKPCMRVCFLKVGQSSLHDWKALLQQVEFCVLPPTPQALTKSRPADVRELPE